MHYLTDAEKGNYFDKKVTVDNGMIVTGHADIGSEKVNGSLEVDGVTTLHNYVKQEKGSYVHNIDSHGNSGYFKIATITINRQYINSPIVMSILQRGNDYAMNISIKFSGANSLDPALGIFKTYGNSTCNAYIHKSNISTWDLYVKQSEAWDSISVFNYANNYIKNQISITWKSEIVTSLPSGAIQAEKHNTLSDKNYKDLTAFTYSTTEQWTGEYWIDGKKIYTRTFKLPTITTSVVETATDIPISDVDRCWIDNSNSYLKIKGSNNYFPLGYYKSQSGWYETVVYIVQINGHIALSCYRNSNTQIEEGYATLRYTKKS